MTHALRSVVLFVLLGLSTTVFADPFHDAYGRGMMHFNAQEYSKARAEFLHAYDLQPEPLVLFNIAQTYRLESNVDKALEYYKKFLVEPKIEEDLRSEAQGHVTRLEEQARAAAEAKRKHDEPARKRDEPARKRRIPFGSKIAAGVTGAGLVSALIFTKLGLDAERALANSMMPTQKDADRVERYQNLINISWGITGAAAIAAVVIYFAAPSYSIDRKAVVVAPTRDGGWSAAYMVRF